MRIGPLTIAAILLSASLAAHADVLYSFTSNSSGPLAGTYFTIDSPGFLPYNASISVATTTGEYVEGGSDGGKLSVSFDDKVELTIAHGTPKDFQSVSFNLKPYDISADGVYTSDSGDTLTISGSPRSSVTPEPSSIALLGTGLLGIGKAMRRRFTAS